MAERWLDMSSPIFWLVGFIVTALTSCLLTGLVRGYAINSGVLDQPGPRRSHLVATPRGGGMAIVLTIAACIGVFLFIDGSSTALLVPVMVGLLLIAGLGWWDDHRQLSARLRFATQAVICGATLALIGGLGPDAFGSPGALSPVWFPVALTAMLWVTNLFNFMDGTDGLAAGQGIFALTGFVILFAMQGIWLPALIAAAALAAIMGFAPWNLPIPRARIFMGDVGSSAIGFLLAVLCVVGTHHNITVHVSFIVMSVFVVDATATLLLRVIRSERWYDAHRQHAYQRLVRGGWSHAKVLGAYSVANLVLVAPAVYWSLQRPGQQVWIDLIVVMALLACWLAVQSVFNNKKLERLEGQ